MITTAENESLSQVGPGTPAGELLRRYWMPIAASIDLEAEPVLPVRLLGENLVLFRDEGGRLGLVAERCPHRSASLAYGIPEADGIRCPYHGWYFGRDGRCLEQPYDDLQGPGTFKERIRVASYDVEELGGLVFAYLGPKPTPLLPRWQWLVQDNVIREIVAYKFTANWLQVEENRLDPVHTEWLHVYQSNWVAKRMGYPPQRAHLRHLKIDFELHELGIIKKRLLEGEDPESAPDWVIGHSMLFPTTSGAAGLQFDVPVDDSHTINWHYRVRDRRNDEPDQTSVPAYDIPIYGEDGRMVVDTVGGQDRAVWVQQGPLTPREQENLGRTDRGVVMYRNWLKANAEKVARSEDPDGVIRDPRMNEPFLRIPGFHGSRAGALGLLDKTEAHVTAK